MVVPDKVLLVSAMSVKLVNEGLIDCCHFSTFPIIPLTLIFDGVSPIQIF